MSNGLAYDTDKLFNSDYLRRYDEAFAPLADQDVRLLELGVHRGGSLLLWRDHFERGLIVGLDLHPVDLSDPSGRIRVYQGAQEDTALLDHLAGETAPDGFDVVIDDCSHLGELTRKSFWHLFEHHLKPGGIYVIEDWGTGYWASWPDGARYRAPAANAPPTRARAVASRIGDHAASRRWPLARRLRSLSERAAFKRQLPSHQYGMVGFLKQLVDECGMFEATREGLGVGPERPSKFSEIRIAPGQAFIFKAGQGTAAPSG